MLILIALSGNYIRIAYFHIISVFIMVLSGWLNIQLLWEMTIKYKGFEFENFILQWWNEGMTYNATVLLQISEILYTIGRNMTIQLCLSLLFRYVQSCTKNYMDRKVSADDNGRRVFLLFLTFFADYWYLFHGSRRTRVHTVHKTHPEHNVRGFVFVSIV